MEKTTLVKKVKEVLAKHKDLCYNGFYNSDKRALELGGIQHTLEELRDKMLKDEELNEIEFCINYFKKHKKTKVLNVNSYGLKHAIEKDYDNGHYISNGSCIVGGILAGFDFEQTGDVTANFNISKCCIVN